MSNTSLNETFKDVFDMFSILLPYAFKTILPFTDAFVSDCLQEFQPCLAADQKSPRSAFEPTICGLCLSNIWYSPAFFIRLSKLFCSTFCADIPAILRAAVQNYYGGPKFLQLGLAELGLGLGSVLGLQLGLVSVMPTGVKLSVLAIYNTLGPTR